jgi:hypothetical protein
VRSSQLRSSIGSIVPRRGALARGSPRRGRGVSRAPRSGSAPRRGARRRRRHVVRGWVARREAHSGRCRRGQAVEAEGAPVVPAAVPGHQLPEPDRDGDRLVVEQQRWHRRAGAQPVAAGRPGARLDRVAEPPQPLDVTAQRPARHLEPLGQLAARPVAAPLQQRQQRGRRLLEVSLIGRASSPTLGTDPARALVALTRQPRGGRRPGGPGDAGTADRRSHVGRDQPRREPREPLATPASSISAVMLGGNLAARENHGLPDYESRTPTRAREGHRAAHSEGSSS